MEETTGCSTNMLGVEADKAEASGPAHSDPYHKRMPDGSHAVFATPGFRMIRISGHSRYLGAGVRGWLPGLGYGYDGLQAEFKSHDERDCGKMVPIGENIPLCKGKP